MGQPEILAEVLRMARSIGNEMAESRIGDMMRLVQELNNQLHQVRLEGAEHHKF